MSILQQERVLCLGSILYLAVTNIVCPAVMLSSDTRGVYEADHILLEGSVLFLQGSNRFYPSTETAPIRLDTKG